ncbi:M23 family metallopeptidase [Leptothermofonsia sp. ETS-13]|uniref:M23 family metallopeptidase n=1 Tax=Leptothermofonsia sp. ETS-13 TaxID=3035696 RepID=UPI003BA2CE37
MATPAQTNHNPWMELNLISAIRSIVTIATPMGLSATAWIWALANVAKALQVKITPSAPRLGDTLSIIAQYDNLETNMTPVVRMGDRTYQTFLIGPNRFRALIATTPLDKPGIMLIRIEGGGEVSNMKVQLKGRSFPTQSIWLPPGKDGDISDAEYNRVNAFKQLITPQKFWNGPFLQPNQGPITGVYGIRRYYNGIFANDYYHRGVDYAGAYGSPVIAPAAGRVVLVGYEKDGFRVNGNIVGLDHGHGVTSAYLHLSRITVKQGDFVKAGQVIGAVGATGAATGPHLHWGLYVNGLSVDPAPWRTKGVE